MVVKEANDQDWLELIKFYRKIYRANHPLLNFIFWDWQYGNPANGRAFICVNDKGEVVGHVGANFKGGLAWIINVYLEESHRGKGILGQLYALAREYYPLAATAANEAGLNLYRNMNWIRYHNLVRYVKVNPHISNPSFETVCKSINIKKTLNHIEDTHYFKQPGIEAIKLEKDNTAIIQPNRGGIRYVDITNIDNLEEEAWEIGANWIDYISSWNDKTFKHLENKKWIIDQKNVVPWRLNPVVKNYFCDVTFLSEKPLDNSFVVHRSYSDHGRVGSL
jgi:hypothetical protein